MPGYNEEIAARILEHLGDTFPAQGDIDELKCVLCPESEQREFLNATEALLKLGFINGKPLYDNGILFTVGPIQISKTGREWLQRRNQPPVVFSESGNTIFRDSIVNYGHVVAMGLNATGTVNTFNQCWQQLESQVDLRQLANELGSLRSELRRSAATREEDAQLGMLAEAEEAAESGDGPGAMSVLSRVGKAVLEAAERIGTDIAAKVIVEASKG